MIIQNQRFADLATYPSISMKDLKAIGSETIMAARSYADEYLMKEMREFEWASQ